MNNLQWVKYPVLNDGFICLVDHMGDDSAIVQAARVSYGKDIRNNSAPCKCGGTAYAKTRNKNNDGDLFECTTCQQLTEILHETTYQKDRQLIRYLLAHGHTTPFEMVEFKFLVRVPMDCWRQWIRHRTASVNEYSTRYTEAIDSCQQTPPGEWRLQATDNKQGSSGYLTEWPQGTDIVEQLNYDDSSNPVGTGNYAAVVPTDTGFSKFFLENKDDGPGKALSQQEYRFQKEAEVLYNQRLRLGIAKEQARKDLPLSTYTEAYWKCDLHNIFNFLRLRMDSHAQLEIRSYANAMAEIVKQIVPVAWEAFEDYVLNAKRFSRMEMEALQDILRQSTWNENQRPYAMQNATDREWGEFLTKLV